ncbi:MAG: acetylornithine transaminase [Bacillota bacterium]|nr:acetylornithine transaminase [Bacillota bacterium]
MSKGYLMNTYGKYEPVFVKGKGSKVWDENGKEYIDFVSGVAVNCLGHAHPAIIKALEDQSEKLIHISNYFWNEPQIELSELVCRLSGMESIFFVNSGTEAIEAALKLSRKYGSKLQGKNKIIYMKNSFHGRTMGALSVTGQEKYQKSFQPLIPNTISVAFNNIEELEAAFGEDVCGLIFEPIQGEGGIIEADHEYMVKARELCDKYDAIMILDEVQCGIGRTGNFFAYQGYGIYPDVVCMAKALGGGFPIGAIAARGKAKDILVPGDHGSTFGGNPLACSVAIAVLKELKSEKIIESISGKSEYIHEILGKLKERYHVIMDIRGAGLLIGIEINKDTKEFSNKCFEKGLLVASAGKNTIRLLPPLNVTYEDIDSALNILEEVIGAW